MRDFPAFCGPRGREFNSRQLLHNPRGWESRIRNKSLGVGSKSPNVEFIIEFILGRLGIYSGIYWKIYSRALGYSVMYLNLHIFDRGERDLATANTGFLFLRDFPAFCGPRGREYLIRDNYCIHMY